MGEYSFSHLAHCVNKVDRAFSNKQSSTMISTTLTPPTCHGRIWRTSSMAQRLSLRGTSPPGPSLPSTSPTTLESLATLLTPCSTCRKPRKWRSRRKTEAVTPWSRPFTKGRLNVSAVPTGSRSRRRGYRKLRMIGMIKPPSASISERGAQKLTGVSWVKGPRRSKVRLSSKPSSHC